ncbi:hypothetical protein BD311DRAFT_750440 [Dichomitus squalens]|uniref:Uncharacterized protein n=1 Tax=Dichomitus squalens TaxID=114155 RepID=A0A4Q9MX31_9APHY|nr:hypothetical protein BD311DRAFT_750440 [Dichomitus squalens]
MRVGTSSLDPRRRTHQGSSSPTTHRSIGNLSIVQSPGQQVAPAPHPSREHRRFRAAHAPRIS